MNAQQEKQAVDEMAKAIDRLTATHGFMQMELAFGHVVTLVAQVQLALRHPGNTGESAKDARKVIDAMIAQIEMSEPRLAEILRWGFDPSRDLPRITL